MDGPVQDSSSAWELTSNNTSMHSQKSQFTGNKTVTPVWSQLTHMARGAIPSAAISHMTVDTLGPNSSVISATRKLDTFEKDVEKRFAQKTTQPNNAKSCDDIHCRNTMIDYEIEREKRHYPCLSNKASSSEPKLSGRRYIPHGYGDDFQFRPHPSFQEPEYTDFGLDWKSRIRYIPSPHNQEASAEIWPEPWKGLRTYPWSTRRARHEWELHPDANSAAKKCQFDGVHKATSHSFNEVTHSMRFGKGKLIVDRRNAIPAAAPGDKSYQVVEYSNSFHKLGSTLPVVNFGGNGKIKPDTFVPLQELPSIPRESFHECEKHRQTQQERLEVKELEKWRAASPLQPPGHTHPLVDKPEPKKNRSSQGKNEKFNSTKAWQDKQELKKNRSTQRKNEKCNGTNAWQIAKNDVMVQISAQD